MRLATMLWLAGLWLSGLWLSPSPAAAIEGSPAPAVVRAPTVVAGRATTTPVIDGRLDDPAWASVPWTTGLQVLDTGAPPSAATRFRVLYDEVHVYVGIAADEPDTAGLRRSATARDGQVWRDDCLELMLDPSGDRVDYFHLVVNPRGTLYDAWMRQGGYVRDVEWNGPIDAAAAVDGNSWSAELAIPLVAIGPFADSGAPWAINLTRARRAGGGQELSTYAPLSGGFHQPAEYADLTLPGADLRAMLWELSPPRMARLARGDGALRYTAGVDVTNRTGAAADAQVRAVVGDSPGDWVAVHVGAGADRRVWVSVDGVAAGHRQVRLELRSSGHLRAVARHTAELSFTPLAVRLVVPRYRRALYATQKLRSLAVEARSDLPASRLRSLSLSVALLSPPTPAPKTATRDAPWSAANRPATARDTVHLPLAHRPPPGRYPVRARLVDPGGGVVAEALDTLRVLPAVAHEWRLQDGVLLHNGDPVLPFGWFSIPPSEMARKDHAFVGMQSYGWYGAPVAEVRAFLDEVAAAGAVAAIYPYPGGDFLRAEAWGRPLSPDEEQRLRLRVRALKDHPGLLAWYMADEPELQPALPERCRRIRQIIADEDPHHPCIMLNDTVAGIRRYAAGGDILMPDPYPTFLADGLAAQPIEKVSKFVAAAVDAAGAGGAAWVTPQGFNYGDYGRLNNRAPDFAEVRNQLYQAVVAGARGFLWYTYGHAANYPALGLGMRWLSFEVADLRAAILAPEAPGVDLGVGAAAPEHLHLSARRVDGQLILFAVNTAPHPQEVALEIAPRPEVDSLWVVSEDRAVPLLIEGVLRDGFPTYGVHIYTTDRDLARRLARGPAARLGVVQARVDSFETARRRPGNLAFEAYGTTVRVSSRSRYSSFPDRIVDGVRGGMRWRDGTPGELPDWLELRWPAPVTLQRIDIYGTVARARIEVPEGDDWRDIEAESRPEVGHLRLDLRAPIRAPVLRVVVTALVAGAGNQTLIHEVEAYAP